MLEDPVNFYRRKMNGLWNSRQWGGRTTTFPSLWQRPSHKPTQPQNSPEKLTGRREFSSQEWGGSCRWKSIRPFCRPHKKFHYSRILTWLKTQGISHFQKLIIFLTARTVWLWLKIGQTCFFLFWRGGWGTGRFNSIENGYESEKRSNKTSLPVSH